MIELTLLCISSLVNFVLGFVVFLKNPKSLTNKLFLSLALSLAVWSIVNYISVHPVIFSQIVWVRLVLFFAAFLCLSVYLTFLTFPSFSLPESRLVPKIFSLITCLVATLTLTPFVFVTNAAGEPAPGPAIPLFALLVVILLGTAIRSIFKKYRKAEGSEKSQLRLVLFGIIATFVLIFINNFIFVVVFNFTSLIPLGSTFTLLFSGSMAYAIVRHKLFDIRAAIARTLAYVFSLGFIGLVYGGIVFGIFSFLYFDGVSENKERALFVALALITATAYPITKKYFDRITTKIFYQDAYDSQVFLDEINTLLVGQIELEQLLKGITDVIEQNLKSKYCVFIVRETAYEDVRIVGSMDHNFNSQQVEQLRTLTPHTHRKVLPTDELDEHDFELKKVQENLNISVLVRLVSNAALDLEGMGYLVLGPKKNGTIYSSQDKQVLNILANEMIIAVENALRFEEIEKFNLTLQNKVDSATSELKRTNEKLKEMDETKDEFISMASHQLRTPLTSVKGYLSMVLEGDVGKVNKKQDKMLEQAFLSSQRMVYLIADLLNVSRLKTGKFIIDPKEANLADVIETEVEQLKPTAKSRDLTLEFKKPEDFPTVTIDETKIRQVIMNFIDNAIYYTPAGGKIEVNIEDKGKTIEYTVKDNGIGVPKAERHNLFSKFYRAGNARKARPDGTGLGLFMAKKVVVAQGGAIIFETEEGKGSTFGFSFAKEKLEHLADESKQES